MSAFISGLHSEKSGVCNDTTLKLRKNISVAVFRVLLTEKSLVPRCNNLLSQVQLSCFSEKLSRVKFSRKIQFPPRKILKKTISWQFKTNYKNFFTSDIQILSTEANQRFALLAIQRNRSLAS